MLRLIFLLLFSVSVQANDPTFTVGTENIMDISTTGAALNLQDDAMSGMKPLGFNFNYYNNTYDEVNIAMNGFMTFNPNFNVTVRRNYLSETLPATGFNYSIFGLWTDLIDKNNNNGSPYIQTFGDTGSKYFVTGWYNINEYRNNNLNSFEIILYENTNAIEFRYDKINISNHDISIGLQGNNEAVTYLRYEDTNSTNYTRTDKWSISTKLDESYSNLSSECLTDSNFSALCNVYDLGNDTEEDDIFDFIDDLIESNQDYGIEEDLHLGFTTEINYETGEGLAIIDYSIEDVFLDNELLTIIEDEEFHNEDNFDFEYVDDDYFDTMGNDNETLEILDITNALPEIYPEDNFLEIAQIINIELEDREEEQFFEQPNEEENVLQQESIEEESQEEEEQEESQQESQILEEEVSELEEDIEPDRPSRQRNIVSNNVASTNSYVQNLTSNIISQSNNSSQTSSGNAISSNSSFSQSGISNQIAAEQTQTQNALQSVQTIEVNPIGNDAMGVAIVQVQTVTTDSISNEITSITNETMTSSEADQVVASVIQSNMESLQEEIEENQNESGEYDVQGQSNLIALMNYKQGWDNYSAMSIPDVAFYEPYQIYTNVVLSDNINAHISMTEASSIALNKMVSSQNLDLFRRY